MAFSACASFDYTRHIAIGVLHVWRWPLRKGCLFGSKVWLIHEGNQMDQFKVVVEGKNAPDHNWKATLYGFMRVNLWQSHWTNIHWVRV